MNHERLNKLLIDSFLSCDNITRQKIDEVTADIYEEINNKPFWVLENNRIPLYLGYKCGKLHQNVGINDAIKFDNEEAARAMNLLLIEFAKDIPTQYKVTEHMFMRR